MNAITMLAAKMDSVLIEAVTKRAAAKSGYLATTINTDLNMESLAGGFVDFFLNLALYGGALTAIGGAIAWGYAHKNGNSSDQDKAATTVLIGGAFMGFRGVLELIGILQ